MKKHEIEQQNSKSESKNNKESIFRDNVDIVTIEHRFYFEEECR